MMAVKTNKRKTKEEGKINLLVASPSDAIEERKLLLNSIETRFRKYNYEKFCKCRLFAHGWEDLASQEGYPQDIINELIIEKMDFVVSLFRHTKGNPVKDPITGIIRSESGTIEELNLTLDKTNNNHPLGMLYYYHEAPHIYLDDPFAKKKEQEWFDLKNFKEKMKSRMLYKEYKSPEEVLDIACKDLFWMIDRYFEL